MGHLIRKKLARNRTGGEEDSNEIEKKITETPCWAHFARYRDNIVSTDAS